jgi:N utilization substance protein A
LETKVDLDIKQLAQAVKTIAEEKNLPEDMVQEIVEQALAAAYRRDYGDREQEVRVSMNLNNGDVDAYISKEVVETVGDDAFEISLKDAQVMKKNAKVGDTIELHQEVKEFGRVAAQTAKQVILKPKALCREANKSKVNVTTRAKGSKCFSKTSNVVSVVHN